MRVNYEQLKNSKLKDKIDKAIAKPVEKPAKDDKKKQKKRTNTAKINDAIARGGSDGFEFCTSMMKRRTQDD